MKTPKSAAPKPATPKPAAPKPATSKSVTPKSAAPKVEPELRILKVATCSSLSGKSTLTYHVGCTEKSEIQMRIYANSGTGFFSKEWVSLNTIQQAFAKVPGEGTITSFILFPSYRGKSINTPSFLFAALMNEGLVRPVEGTRSYASTDPKGFMAEVKALMASGVSLKAEDKPSKAKVADKQVKTDGKPGKVVADAKPATVEEKVKTEKASEQPLKAEAKATKVQAKPATVEKKPTTPSKKAESKAAPKKNSPR